MRMSNKNGRTDFIEKRWYGIYIYFIIYWSYVGNHLPEILVKSCRIFFELHPLKKVWPDTQAESSKPLLFVRYWWYCCFHCTAACIPSSRLIYQIYSEIAAKKNILKTFPAVRSCFPCFGKLPDTMPHDKRVFPGFDRYLVKNICVVSSEGLTWWRRSIGIKSTWTVNHSSSNSKTSLILDDQRLLFYSFLRWNRKNGTKSCKNEKYYFFI